MRREAAVLTRRSLYQQKDPRLKDVSTHCGNRMIAHKEKHYRSFSVTAMHYYSAYVDTELRRLINPQN